MNRLERKVAVITGAGSCGPGTGVGKAISVIFAREGGHIVLVDKVKERAEETLGLIEKEGGEAVVLTADITDPSACSDITEKALRQFGHIDILVNNAAISPLVGLLETEQDLYETIMAVNAAAPFRLTKAIIPPMISSGGGVIVNITSIAAIRGTGIPETAY